MRYGEGDRESENVEDRRGESGGGMFRRGGGIPLPMGGGGLSITSLIVIGVICLMLGINPLELLMGGGDGVPRMPDVGRPGGSSRSPFEIPNAQQPRVAPQNDEMSRFVRRVLADTEDVWERVFAAAGKRYEKPTLVLFSGYTQTACGVGQSAMGPFYCPLDKKVYIDLRFFRMMSERFHAAGDFAQAYVIAHEVGHHVQTLLGITEQMESRRARASRAEANALSVRLELQADCFAGVWARRAEQAKQFLDPGDLEEAVAAATAIGDDTLQRQSQGHVVPDSFTHGTSAQRVRWLKRGFETGDVQACDTFRSQV
jgi:predicted metalloprotease